MNQEVVVAKYPWSQIMFAGPILEVGKHCSEYLSLSINLLYSDIIFKRVTAAAEASGSRENDDTSPQN